MKKICIIASNYYEDIISMLIDGTNEAFNKHKKKFKTKIIYVPGVFEIPYAISKLIKKYDGFIAVGCIIKGETPNFDFISQAITNGIMQLSILNKKPIGNAVITCLDKDQAKKRIFKGEKAASAVLDVLDNSYLK